MSEKMNIFQKLQAVQSELKAPKNLYNSFGKYNYRNAESILEGLKPLEAKYKVATIITDNIRLIGDRYYVESEVTFFDCESDNFPPIKVTAMARESVEKKGMDEAQITGATSSYARKYALNGMFLLDDTKDMDSDEYQTQAQAKAKKAPAKTVAKAEPTPAPAPAPKKAQFPNRNKFITFCTEHDLDTSAICKELQLNKNSKDEDFIPAMAHVIKLASKKDEESLGVELPFPLD